MFSDVFFKFFFLRVVDADVMIVTSNSNQISFREVALRLQADTGNDGRSFCVSMCDRADDVTAPLKRLSWCGGYRVCEQIAGGRAGQTGGCHRAKKMPSMDHRCPPEHTKWFGYGPVGKGMVHIDTDWLSVPSVQKPQLFHAQNEIEDRES